MGLESLGGYAQQLGYAAALAAATGWAGSLLTVYNWAISKVQDIIDADIDRWQKEAAMASLNEKTVSGACNVWNKAVDSRQKKLRKSLDNLRVKLPQKRRK